MRRKSKRGTNVEPAPEHRVEIEVPDGYLAPAASAPTEISEALLGVPTSEPCSLADQLVARAEQSRGVALTRTPQDINALVYIGDAVLALTERLTELDR